MRQTKLVFRGYGDTDPSTTWQLVDWTTYYPPGPQVFRGYGFYIYGTLQNITLKDFEFDGNCYPGDTGDESIPPNTTTGDGWDLSHKALFMNGLVIDTLTIQNVSFHNWRGEIIYQGGGASNGNLHLSGSELFESNGNALSVSLGIYANNNRIYRCVHAGSESVHWDMPMVFRDNHISECGIGINYQADYDTHAECAIRNNYFTQCGRGIYCNTSSRPALIDGNQFVDNNPVEDPNSGDILLSPSYSYTRPPVITGITITNNHFSKQTHGGGFAISLGCEDNSGGGTPYELSNIEIANNYIDSAREALAANKRYLMPISLTIADAPASQTENITIHDNTFINVQRDIENPIKSPSNTSPMPLMWNNNRIGGTDQANNYVQTDGTNPTVLSNSGIAVSIDYRAISGVQIIESDTSGAWYVPVLATSNFRDNQQIIFTNQSGGAPLGVYFPPSWGGFECPQGRYLYSDTYIVLKYDAGRSRFIEQTFIDNRGNHYNQVTSGTDMAFLGFENLILTPSSATTYTSFSGIGHMAMARVTASNGNVTIQHGGSIQLAGGTNLTMTNNQTILFYYNTSNVLVQIS